MIRRHVRHAPRLATIVLGFSALCAIATATPAAAASSPIGPQRIVDRRARRIEESHRRGGRPSSFGALHGFDGSFFREPFPPWSLKFGDNTVCAYGIDAGSDANALLGCRTVTGGRSPFGSLDVVDPLSGGHLRVAGWVIDPDAVRATGVHVYIDGSFDATLHADRARGDVGAHHPQYGTEHGFDAELDDISNGAHTVCVYGIDSGISSGRHSPNALLGCRQVTTGGNPIDVRDVLPMGSLDLVDVQGATVRVAGWAIDPDTAAAIAVQIHLDGVLHAGTQADRSRTDVAAAYPGYGDKHGFDLTLGPNPGTHSLCVYALDSTSLDSHSTKRYELGCRTITV